MAENYQDLKKQIQELRKEIISLGGESFKNLNAAIEAAGGGMEGARKVITRMKKDVEDLKDTFGNLSATLKNTLADLKGQESALGLINKSYSKLEGIAQKLSNHKKEEEILTVKQLKSLSKQTQEEYNQLKNARELAKSRKTELENKIKSGEATKKETDEYEKLKKYTSEINAALNLKGSYLKQIVSLSEEEVKNEENIKKTLGITGKLFNGIAKSLEHIGIESEAFENINKDLRKAAKDGDSLKVVGAGIKSIFKSVGESFKDPLVQIVALGKVFHELYSIGTEFNKKTFEIQKDLGLSFENARGMTEELEHMVVSSGEVADSSLRAFVNFNDLVKSTKELNDYYGTAVSFSKEQLAVQAKLQEVAGLTTEEASKLNEYEALTGKSAESVYNSIGKTNKGIFSQKKITQEVLKTSGQLAAQYKNNPDLIAKAVVQAQKLGMTLEQTKKITSGLLNFEDSISAELEAELLTGQDLNLERARGLALQGDTAGAAAELMKNLGPNGLTKFQKMNVIQQEAYAKALGMNADELGDSLVKQKKLQEIEKTTGKGLKAKIEELKKAGDIEKASLLEQEVLKGKSVELAEMELDNQTAINKNLEKAKSSLESKIAPIMGGISKTFEGISSFLAENQWIANVLGYTGLGVAIVAGIGGIGLAIKAIKDFTVNTMKGKPGEKPSRPLYVDVVGGGDGGGGGSSGRSRKSKGTKAKGKGFLRKMGRTIASVAGMGGLSELVGDDEGALDTISEAASDMSSGGSATSRATPPRDPSTGRFMKKGTEVAGKGKGFFGKIGSFFGGLGKKIGGGMGSIKKLFQGPIAKGFGKVLGPILTIIESIGSAASLVSDARERKAAGENVDAGMLGKSLVQAAAYPIANLATNLIPGIGQAISIGDGILGAFGLSPIKWLTDNLVDLVPNDAFSGLGNLALGEKAEKAMASGGIVTGPTRALVGEAGNEAVIPLDKFYAKLDELISVVKSGGNIYIDGTKIGTAMAVGTYKTQ